jgi:hypothetical protein
MRSHNDSIDTTHTPPPLSFYNTFKEIILYAIENWRSIVKAFNYRKKKKYTGLDILAQVYRII